MNIKQKIYLSSGLAIIIAVLLLGSVVKPLILEIKTTSSLVKERNEKLVILQRTDQEYLKQLEQDYNNIKQDISLVKSGFLNTDQVVDFFMVLENIASSTSNKLEIQVVDFPFFNLYLLGNFSNLMKFLGWLENSKYFVDVDSIQIRQFAEKSLSLEEAETISVGDIKTILKIRVYIEKANFYEHKETLKSS